MTLPQRPLRGSRISSFYPVKSLPSLSSLDSAFQLQEYISLLIRLNVHDVEAIVSLPGKRKGEQGGEGKYEDEKAGEESDADKTSNSEIMVDEPCWIYEQLRRLAQDLTHPLINTLQQECTRSTCPEMKAGEWLYLCVAHGNDGALEQCCAIDYILHTLDSATALLNTPRAFPSRLQIPTSSHRHFGSLARRLGRIFAHAYFHHREAFEQAEAESSLYARFLALTTKFELVPPEFMVIPPFKSNSDSDDEDGQAFSRGARNPPPPIPAMVSEGHALSGAAVAQHAAEGQWDVSRGLAGRFIADVAERGTSPLSPGSDSPRKMGRNRTGTMVLNEAYAIAEELSKANGSGHSEQKKDVERDLNSFTLLARPEPQASGRSEEEEATTASTLEPLLSEHDQQSSPVSEPIPLVTPSSSTALPETDVTEVTAVNATPEASPTPNITEFEKKDTEPVVQSAETKEKAGPASEQEPAPATIIGASEEAKEEEEEKSSSSSIPEIPEESIPEVPMSTPAPETTTSAVPEETQSASTATPEPNGVSAGDEVLDSPVVPREDGEDVPSATSPPLASTETAAAAAALVETSSQAVELGPGEAEVKEEEREKAIEPVTPQVPGVEVEKVESEMKELVEGHVEKKGEGEGEKEKEVEEAT